MLGCAFSVVVIVISGQSMIVSSRNKPVNTVLQAQIVVSQIKYWPAQYNTCSRQGYCKYGRRKLMHD